MSKPTAGFRRLPRVADRMTHELHQCVKRAEEAERAGAFADALEWHRAVPMFEASRHGRLLQQMSEVEGALPDWAWARWIAYLATRCEDGAVGAAITRLRHQISDIHFDLLDDCYAQGGDPVRVEARIMGESWLFRRCVLSGRIFCAFLRDQVHESLQERADLAHDWFHGATHRDVSAFALHRSPTPGTLVAEDLATGGEHVLLDLGARGTAPDGFVLGRVVDSGIDDLEMFDIPPLPVAPDLADDVACGPESWLDSWLDVVVDSLDEGWLTSEDLMVEDYPLLTDVGGADLIRTATPPTDLDRVLAQHAEGRDEVSRSCYRILQRAARPSTTDPDLDPTLVAAAALNPHAIGDARRRLTSAEHRETWRRWADLVQEPARSALISLAGDAGRRSA